MNPNDIVPGRDVESIRKAFVEKLFFELAKFPGVSTKNDHFLALSFLIRDQMLHRWIRTAREYLEGEHRTVIYLSAEYLLGPQLGSNLLNLDLAGPVRTALAELGLDLDALLEHEEEPGLGNGGLGRLAACFMDSLATLEIPAIGHGIRYEFGIFDQEIRNGWQVERTDRWLRLGNPWEIRRYEIEHPVGFGGRTEHHTDAAGRHRVRWVPERTVRGIPFDTPVLGHGVDTCNFLRLWTASAAEEFDLDAFQVGEYWRAVDQKIRSENITKVLYPNDESAAGKQLRLEQEYFFVSCALQDCIRLLLQRTTIHKFAEKFCVQLNDTHPALAVLELMRLLLDEHDLGWDEAWSITRKSIAYTNHTLLTEALEVWPLPLFSTLLPRHTELLFEINRRFLEEVGARYPGDVGRLQRMSLIDERGQKLVRMANLAAVAAHSVNGVAALHSRLLRETVMSDFATMYPERFTNVTNGVTPRRFLALANPGLTSLITEAIGPGFLRDLDRLRELERFADDASFAERFRAVKLANKRRLADWLRAERHFTLNPASMFDAQCKRIHEYKRQHLLALHAAWLLRRIRRGDTAGLVPRTLILAGKAAPGYRAAKLIIRFLHAIAEDIERVPGASELLRLVFVPDFNVKNAQRIYPATELSEQISTAGKEASGTGNMKFAMNGALTIGTLDGANVEIRDAVGHENFFLFGLEAHEVAQRMRDGYHPHQVLAKDPGLAEILDDVAQGRLSPNDPGLFRPLIDDLLGRDPYLVLADFRAYVECQERVAATYADPAKWTRMAILNVARVGSFSSDRSITEYADKIWEVPRVKIP